MWRSERNTTRRLSPSETAVVKKSYPDLQTTRWALGLVYSEMLLGDLGLVEPFNNENYQTVLKSFKRGKFLQDMSGADGLFSDASLDLRARFLCVEPEGRICCGPKGFEELKEHPFMMTLDFEKLLKKEIKGPLADHYGDVKVKALRPQSNNDNSKQTYPGRAGPCFVKFRRALFFFSSFSRSSASYGSLEEGALMSRRSSGEGTVSSSSSSVAIRRRRTQMAQNSKAVVFGRDDGSGYVKLRSAPFELGRGPTSMGRSWRCCVCVCYGAQRRDGRRTARHLHPDPWQRVEKKAPR
jgi:hypothetical protein